MHTLTADNNFTANVPQHQRAICPDKRTTDIPMTVGLPVVSSVVRGRIATAEISMRAPNCARLRQTL